ncbi:MAG: dipeptidyl-peptidase 3 family protein [Gammaproteobacteria bacterium]
MILQKFCPALRAIAIAECVALTVLLAGCATQPEKQPLFEVPPIRDIPITTEQMLEDYAEVKLTANIGHLTVGQRQALRLLIEAAQIMDGLFWRQAYGSRDTLLAGLPEGPDRRLAEINYGPWDRLDGDMPFLPGFGSKSPGAEFYPPDMTREEFEAAELPGKRSWYSLIQRDIAGQLVAVPYHVAYSNDLNRAARLIGQAAELVDDPSFKRYLTLRARALITDDYQPSDLAWMDMKTNTIDVVIGPIEQYEDRLFAYKTAYSAYVLLKDLEWSKRLERFARFLPELQDGLPVSELYKSEKPGSDSDLNAYDVLFYAGHSNAGSKTIAINLPNDEQVQLARGTRRLQLKNAMRAKFDQIMLPIAEELVVEEQRKNVTFDAFFANTMFHEVAHGLGLKNTVNGKGTVRSALREYQSAMEEGKADILGLYMITWLYERGELPGSDLMDYYVTFMTGIFRSVRFGSTSAHGQANMIRFNFFRSYGAFSRDSANGHYRVDLDKMRVAMDTLSAQLLVIQGNGDHAAAGSLLSQMGIVTPELKRDLDRLSSAEIPVDVVFDQGTRVLGLE